MIYGEEGSCSSPYLRIFDFYLHDEEFSLENWSKLGILSAMRHSQWNRTLVLDDMNKKLFFYSNIHHAAGSYHPSI